MKPNCQISFTKPSRPTLSFSQSSFLSRNATSFTTHSQNSTSLLNLTPKFSSTTNQSPDLSQRTDEEIIEFCESGMVPAYSLESKLAGDLTRAVSIRRQLLERQVEKKGVFDSLPFQNYDYKKVLGVCAENVIGYVPIPVGTAGPLLMDGANVIVPMATTEGCLIASTHRGCKAITESGGVSTSLIDNGMTRAPLIRMPSIKSAVELKFWIEKQENFYQIAAAFNSTSRFARLISIKPILAGRHVYLRFKSVTGDAMGMNMVSKGVEKAMGVLLQYFPDLTFMSLSGNVCTDKKPSAFNWIEGRGKSVISEAVIKGSVIKKVLKTTVDDIIDLNIHKNLVGSAMAGSIGGFNAHAANIVSAIFIACGQDPAQNVESSNCITLMESINDGKDLYMTCTMPSIEVGTVGGGTHLGAQSACLDMLGVKGANNEAPGRNAEKLARVICSSVLAGELSIMSALAAGHLIQSHLKHNRIKQDDIVDDINMGHTLAGQSPKLGDSDH